MDNAPGDNVERLSSVLSCRTERLVDARLEVGNVGREHAPENRVRANVEEARRVESGGENLALLDGFVMRILQRELVDDELVEAVDDGHLRGGPE